MTMSDAQARLASALESLQTRLSDLADRMEELEAVQAERDALKESSAAMAEDLQKAVAREAEFADLAEETSRELDSVITDVRDALGQKGASDG